MSGDGSHKEIKVYESRENSIKVKLRSEHAEINPNSVPTDGFRKNSNGNRPCSITVPEEKRVNESPVKMNETVRGSIQPKVRYNMPKTSIVDAAEFNQNITSWFGEKGFTAMRSFFRASVLNSLQNEVENKNQYRCSKMDAVIVSLITDYLLKNSQYFTMSVFTNEVLRPLSGCSTVVKNLLHRIGKSQSETIESVLSKEDVSFILRSLDFDPHSLLGAEILHRYFEDGSQNLLGIFVELLKDNVRYLSVRDRAVRDNDIVAAFSEGLNEEIGKFQYWFSDFNDQFVDVSIKLKKMVSMKGALGSADNKNSEDRLKEEDASWERVMMIDDHLRRQQESLLKMRDKERRKLVLYAKELESLHKEMNAKLKSIQSYERFIKEKEKHMRGGVYLERNFILEKLGRGDYLSGGNSNNEGDGVKYSTLNKKQSWDCWDVPITREASTQKFGETVNVVKAKGNCGNPSDCSRIMDENLELKSVLREQHLRINALTKRVAALSVSQSIDWELRREQNNTVRQFEPAQKMEQPVPKLAFCDGGVRSSLRHPRHFSSLQTVVRRAKNELGGLRAEKDAMDVQYERLLNNKLSRK